MSAVDLPHYLVVSALLFCLGLLGVIVRRNVLIIYMSLELMLNAGNLGPGRRLPFQQQSQRPDHGLFYHHGGGGGSRGGPGADCRPLSPPANHACGGFDHAEIIALK